MKTTCTRYMFKGKGTDEFSRLSEINYYSDKKPEPAAVVHAVILPAKESAEHAWGSGGVVAENGQLAEESRLGNIFGEAYPFDRHDAVSRDETVYFIPGIPKHWGRFLLDILCRFWFLMSVVAHNEAFRQLHEYYTTRPANPLKKMQSLIVIACKPLWIIFTILRKGVRFAPERMMKDIVRPDPAKGAA